MMNKLLQVCFVNKLELKIKINFILLFHTKIKYLKRTILIFYGKIYKEKETI